MFFEWLKKLIRFRLKPKREEKVLDININAKNLINYYCAMKVAPEYALLVKGPWGCGKSHLVKDCIKELEVTNKEFKFLYVSLYGINDISDIEAKFFEQLNPTMNKILSNKKVMFASRIAKGVLKGALKIDLDGDGKAETTVSVAVPNINLADYLTDTANCILVFDDLERCELDLQVILGYMNYFIEKDGYKVVIIADEDKLISQKGTEKGKYQYIDIKEKLIGKTVQVDPDVYNVFDNFVDDIFPADTANDLISHDDIKKLLSLNKDRIISVFHQSKHENLRSLRKCFLDLKQWIEIFDKDIKDKKELLEHFFSLFVAISMEIHSGHIKPEELSQLIGLSFWIKEAMDSNNDKQPSNLKLASDKYDLDFADTLINPVDWSNFFLKGYLDKENVIVALKSTKYFMEASTPNWKKLWYLLDLEDEEFEKIIKAVQHDFENRNFKEPGVIKHLMGIYLDHIKHGLSSSTEDEVLEQFTKYINDIFADKTVKVTKETLEDINGFGSYDSLGYTSKNNEKFKTFSNLLVANIKKEQKRLLAISATKIVETMKTSPKYLNTLLTHTSGEKSEFANLSVLQYIDDVDFFMAYTSLKNEQKRYFSQVLNNRYQHVGSNHELSEELEWLERFASRLSEYLSDQSAGPSKIVMTYTHTDLLKIIEKMKS
jgi:hypothetical protein